MFSLFLINSINLTHSLFFWVLRSVLLFSPTLLVLDTEGKGEGWEKSPNEKKQVGM